MFAYAELNAAHNASFFGASFKKEVTCAEKSMELVANGGNSFNFVASSLFVENAHGQITV